MMKLTFRQIADYEVEEAYEIICEVAAWLLGKGVNQWQEPLPKEVYRQRHRKGFNYGLWVGERLAGIVSLTDDSPKYWKDELPQAPFVWLTTLVTRADFKGTAFGRRILEFAEKHVWDTGIRRICLDCHFPSRRFKIAGMFPKPSNAPTLAKFSAS